MVKKRNSKKHRTKIDESLTCLGVVRRGRHVLGVVPKLLDLVRCRDLLDELLRWPGGRHGLDRDGAHRPGVPDRVSGAGRRPEPGAAVPVEGHHSGWRL